MARILSESELQLDLGRARLPARTVLAVAAGFRVYFFILCFLSAKS